jgi:hypothetical protein
MVQLQRTHSQIEEHAITLGLTGTQQDLAHSGVSRMVKGETGPSAGFLGIRQSFLRRDQDLPITVESNHNTVRANGLRHLYRMTTRPNRSINDHESRAEFEDR